MNWTRVSNGYHLLMCQNPWITSVGSVKEMAGGWRKARIFVVPKHPTSSEDPDDITQRFEVLKDAKAWVAVTCTLEK
jgi:hypothetical protein